MGTEYMELILIRLEYFLKGIKRFGNDNKMKQLYKHKILISDISLGHLKENIGSVVEDHCGVNHTSS